MTEILFTNRVGMCVNYTIACDQEIVHDIMDIFTQIFIVRIFNYLAYPSSKLGDK